MSEFHAASIKGWPALPFGEGWTLILAPQVANQGVENFIKDVVPCSFGGSRAYGWHADSRAKAGRGIDDRERALRPTPPAVDSEIGMPSVCSAATKAAGHNIFDEIFDSLVRYLWDKDKDPPLPKGNGRPALDGCCVELAHRELSLAQLESREGKSGREINKIAVLATC
jgi:hypothetical protein